MYSLCAQPMELSSAEQARDPNEAWAAVLANYVDEQGRTDFRALAKKPSDLETYVTYLAAHGPKSEPKKYDTPEKILAFYINGYNALAMHGVIDRGIPADFDSIFKRARFFKFRKVNIDGMRISLSALENDIIRPLGDPRIHFALNCMVKDCPRLPMVPFTAEELGEQLEFSSREFFADKKHLIENPRENSVRVSEILDFYTEDFAPNGRDEELIAFINQYRAEKIPNNWTVDFIDYDWTVNQQP